MTDAEWRQKEGIGLRSMQWTGDSLLLLDQTLLPEQEVWLECVTPEQVAQAIETMRVRGAPAIAAAAAFGVALAALRHANEDGVVFQKEMETVIERLAKTRPTAVNLFWALERMRARLKRASTLDASGMVQALVEEALRIAEEDVETNRRIGAYGEKIVPPEACILTYCNTGSLATVEYGTALGVIRAAHDAGKQIRVIACETRPYLQGARLTSFELRGEGIPVTLIADNTAGYMMARGEIDLVIVGADRIAANGDVANKIGTYSLAVLAHAHRIPFYVAAPLSTFDLKTECGSEIPVEQRPGSEVVILGGKRLAPEGVPALHPAFDITPHHLVRGIITENGIIEYPDAQKVRQFVLCPTRPGSCARPGANMDPVEERGKGMKR